MRSLSVLVLMIVSSKGTIEEDSERYCGDDEYVYLEQELEAAAATADESEYDFGDESSDSDPCRTPPSRTSSTNSVQTIISEAELAALTNSLQHPAILAAEDMVDKMRSISSTETFVSMKSLFSKCMRFDEAILTAMNVVIDSISSLPSASTFPFGVGTLSRALLVVGSHLEQSPPRLFTSQNGLKEKILADIRAAYRALPRAQDGISDIRKFIVYLKSQEADFTRRLTSAIEKIPTAETDLEERLKLVTLLRGLIHAQQTIMTVAELIPLKPMKPKKRKNGKKK